LSQPISRVLIQGDGVAAWCCGLLLRRAGFDVLLKPGSRPRLPAVMLSDAAVALMRDVFGKADLFHAAPRVVKRIVAWGPDPKVVVLDHAAVVVSEQDLLEALGTQIIDDDSNAPPDWTPDWPPDWTIIASRPLPGEVVEHRFGNRFATATPVELKHDAEPAACWMESLEAGWLFLITTAPGTGWMLSVGAPAAELISRSHLVVERIGHCAAATGTFPCAPRIVSPLCSAGWLACGTAALTFDPICGDGTANAVREAILGAAVITALHNGGDTPSLLAHYEGRLTAGFRKHLEICHGFYRSGGNGDWWKNEAESLLDGLAWCDERLGSNQPFKYRLNGFRLEPA
jgi:hypothetical protein